MSEGVSFPFAVNAEAEGRLGWVEMAEGHEGSPAQIGQGMQKFLKCCSPPTESGCVLWVGPTNCKGHGVFRLSNHIRMYAHRFAWELANGKIPLKMVLHHTCLIPSCVSIDHLQLMTTKEHMKHHFRSGERSR